MTTPIGSLVVLNNVHYQALLREQKVLSQNSFKLSSGTGAKKCWNLSDLALVHRRGDPGNLVTEQSIRKLSKYRIRLVINSFSKQPVCRFDSDGIHHENIVSTIPLIMRRISTPHFHEYDSNGIEYAFKTPLLIQNEAAVKNDVLIGMSEMCKVYNILTPGNAGLQYVTQSSFFSSTPVEDIHKDVNFPVAL